MDCMVAPAGATLLLDADPGLPVVPRAGSAGQPFARACRRDPVHIDARELGRMVDRTPPGN